MRGRPPIPTAIKEKKGTLEKSRILEFELSPPTIGIPAMPENLNIHGQREWTTITQELHSLDMLTKIDMGLINSYAFWMGIYYEATEFLLKEGAVVNIGGKSVEVHGHEVVIGGKNERNPWYDVAMKASETALRVGVMFGITPSARTRIPGKEKKKSGIADMMKKKTG